MDSRLWRNIKFENFILGGVWQIRVFSKLHKSWPRRTSESWVGFKENWKFLSCFLLYWQIIKVFSLGVGEMVQLVKCLPYKYEYLVSITKTQVRKARTVVSVCSLSPGEKDRRIPGTSQSGLVSKLQTSRRHRPQTKVGSDGGMCQDWPLSSKYVCTLKRGCTHSSPQKAFAWIRSLQ